MARFLPVVAIALAFAGCGSSEPESAAPSDSRARAAYTDAPPPLKRLYAQANQLLDGGPDAFEARLRELRGYPVVVNKWGSWCAPCRRELPHFQQQAVKHADDVAFLGVDALDPVPEAEELLERFPLTYPSYKDWDLEITTLIKATVGTPVTVFYDSKGEMAYIKQGEYKTERDLAEDIERYAR